MKKTLKASLNPTPIMYGWQVSIPVSLSHTGERIRRRFKTKEAAELYAADIRHMLQQAQETPASEPNTEKEELQATPDPLLVAKANAWDELEEASEGRSAKLVKQYLEILELTRGKADPLKVVKDMMEIMENLEHTGKTPKQAIRQFLAAWSKVGDAITDIATEHAKHTQQRKDSRNLEEALAAWLEASKDLREPTRANYKLTSNQLLRRITAQTLVSDLTVEQVMKCYDPQSKSWATQKNLLGVFFNFCAKQSPPWMNAVEMIASLPKPLKWESQIVVMKPRELRDIMFRLEVLVAKGYLPRHIVGHYALAVFAGIRQEEINKLRKEDFREDGIELGASITKKGKRRFVNYTPQLKAWLEAYPHEGLPVMRRLECLTRRFLQYDVALHGLSEQQRERANAAPPSRGKWKQNILRHTHASAAIAGGATLEALLFQFGHTGSHDTLRAHYVGVYSQANAKRYKEIMPLLNAANDIEELPETMDSGWD